MILRFDYTEVLGLRDEDRLLTSRSGGAPQDAREPPTRAIVDFGDRHWINSYGSVDGGSSVAIDRARATAAV